jgi:hypothetical protein
MVKQKEFHKDIRAMVIEHHKNGVPVKDIWKYMAEKISKFTIRRWINLYNTNG